MSLPSLTGQDISDNGKLLRTITSVYPVTEEINQDDTQRPEHVTDDPSKTRPDVESERQQSEMIGTCPTESAGPSSPAKSSSATSPRENPTTLPLGIPPPSSRHYFLKEMWPGQPICHLCHEEYKRTNRAIRALPCGDIFHRACIDHLLGQRDGRCPSCEASVPAEWYMPHQYDPTEPAGSPCLCPAELKAGVTAVTNSKNGSPSSTSFHVLAIHKLYKRTKESLAYCIPGRRPKRSYTGYKTETGQTRYVESETRVALPGPRFGNVNGVR